MAQLALVLGLHPRQPHSQILHNKVRDHRLPGLPNILTLRVVLLGKKQLNQLITFLDKGGAKEVLGGRPESNALRSVRAKREADEAGASSLCYMSIVPNVP